MTGDETRAEEPIRAGRCLRSSCGSTPRYPPRPGDCSRSFAADVDDGLAGEAVEEALGEFKTKGPLWQLKVNCLRYCGFVDAHHGAEDRLLFPVLRASDPGIRAIVDRLEADHRRVSDLLDAVEDASRALTNGGGEDARRRVVEGLEDLRGHLLEHLDFEEENAGPVIRRLDRL